MAETLSERYSQSVGETRTHSVRYVNALSTGELLTGTPTVVEQTTTDLTISSVAVTTGALTIKGKSTAAAAALTFQVAGATTANSPYRLRVTATTDAAAAQTIVRDILLGVHN